jgi:similar to stage IV sporulation protein
MVVRNGFPAVRPGEEVKAGQVLVQGRIPIVNDNEEETAVYYVRADADIMARTKTEYEKELPLLHTIRVPTGKKRMGVYLRAGNRSLTFLTPSFSKGEWDFQMEESQLTLFSDCYLPFYAGKILGKEVVSYEKTYSDSELEMISDTFYSLFSENLREKGVHILGNNDKIEKSISGNRISGTLITEESIVRYQPVNTTDAEETTDSE